MVLTAENYYSQEANEEYMSVSQFKDFCGTYGKMPCEFTAMEKLKGRWEEPKSKALMVGSYVDSYFEGTLDKFKAENPDLFKRDGTLKAEFVKADEIIQRIERDDYFMKFMSGKKQVIMTGELFGTKWKVKMDSYIPDIAIVDLKVMASITKLEWVRDIGYLDFVRYWGYDIQGAIYQEIVRQNTGKKLPFYIAGATKESEPDIRIIHITDNYLAEALNLVEMNMARVLAVKSGDAEPDRCELCDCCRKTRVLKAPNDRYTFWEQLAANGYDPSKIKKPCETDCSQSTASIVKAVGYRLNKPKLKAVSVYLTTYNMRSAFKTAGAKVLTDQKYLTSGTCLKPGDILLNDNHHVAIAVSGDASSNATPAKKNYLEKGDTGSEVTAMQKMLIKVGYSCGAAGADGDFGSDTDSALRKFQKDNGLTVDGQYGTNSKAKLTALYNKKVGTTTSNKKDVTTVAKEVIAGKWGSGDERKKKLTAAGYNYDTVQKKVNELLKTRTKKSVAEVAKEVVSGKWGNGADRKKKLEAAGYNYAEVQKEVNKLLK